MEKRKVKKEELEAVVLRFGGKPQRVALGEDSTVQDAIDEAGFTVKPGDGVTVNGETVDKDELDETLIEDADRVVITPRFEGGNK